MKKILSIALAMIMVMALSITVFADVDIASAGTYPTNENLFLDIPEGTDVSNGATVTIKVKGTSDNTAVRFYLTAPGDNSRVTEVSVAEVVDGAFEATFDMVIDSTGAIQGSGDPSVIAVKGPDSSTPLSNTTVEVLTFVGVEAPAADAPAADETPADTGIVLAVLPMVIAAAAVVASKRK